MRELISAIILFFILYTSMLNAQVPSEYYPLHIGDFWNYEFKQTGGGTVFEHYFYHREVVADTVMSNGKKYYKVRYKYYSDYILENIYYVRFDSISNKVFAYEEYSYCGCDGFENEIYSFNTTLPGREWTSCCNIAYSISFQDSSAEDSLSYFVLDGDGLRKEDKKFAKNIGLTYDNRSEITVNISELIGYSVNGKTWGILTGLNNEEFSLKNFQLFQNFPNPFNSTTKITYYLKSSSNIQIKIFNLAGREITELVNQKQNAGQHSVTFDASNLASGVYFYKLKAGFFEQSRKMLLIR